jgi:hypothetical protein
MPPQLHSVIELIEKSYQFYAFLFTTFVICMGIARWLGKWIWYEAEKLRRKKLRIPVASLIYARSEQSFTYWSLAQGGLVGAAVVFYFFVSHIVFDFVFKGRIEGARTLPVFSDRLSCRLRYCLSHFAQKAEVVWPG